jgi:hypothetical protein
VVDPIFILIVESWLPNITPKTITLIDPLLGFVIELLLTGKDIFGE